MSHIPRYRTYKFELVCEHDVEYSFTVDNSLTAQEVANILAKKMGITHEIHVIHQPDRVTGVDLARVITFSVTPALEEPVS